MWLGPVIENREMEYYNMNLESLRLENRKFENRKLENLKLDNPFDLVNYSFWNVSVDFYLFRSDFFNWNGTFTIQVFQLITNES